jgi:hypothetical protein
MSQHEDFGLRKCAGNALGHSHAITFWHEVRMGAVAAVVIGILTAVVLGGDEWLTIAAITVVASLVAAIVVHIGEFFWHLAQAPRRLRDDAFDRLFVRVADLEGDKLDSANAELKAASAKQKIAAREYEDRYFTVYSDGVLWMKANEPAISSFAHRKYMQMVARCPEHDTYELKGVQISGNGKEWELDLRHDVSVGVHPSTTGASVFLKCLAGDGHVIRDVVEGWGGFQQFGELQKRASNRWDAEARTRRKAQVADAMKE